jgi:hypothetical protein
MEANMGYTRLDYSAPGEKTCDAYLSGNTNFVLEYFEAAGQARVRFASSFVSLERPTVGTKFSN